MTESRADLLLALLRERYGPDAELHDQGVPMSETDTSVDLHAWATRYTRAFLTFENREMAMWPSDAARDRAIVEWTLRCLGNPDNKDVLPVLSVLVERHGKRVQA